MHPVSSAAALPATLPVRGILWIAERRFDFGALSFEDGTRLSPKAAHVLLVLARQAMQTVGKDELLDEVWQGRFPVPDVLVQAIGEIRRALGDSAREAQALLTVPKVGYRLVATVRWQPVDDVAPRAPRGADTEAELRAIVQPPALLPPRRQRWMALLPFAAIGVLGIAALLPYEPGRLALSDPQRLTSELGPEIQPRLAPAGGMLAYVRRDPSGGRWKVHLRDLRGAAPRTLAPDIDSDDVLPAWSPDGAQLAFQRFDANGCHYVVHRLVDHAEREVGGCFTDLLTPFAWQPDGRALLTTDRVDSTDRVLQLVLLDLQTGQRSWFGYRREPQQADSEPKYSPDGRYVAFRRGGGSTADLYVAAVDGGATRRVSRIAGPIRGFDWLDGGDGFLLGSDHLGVSAMFHLALDGTLTRLPATPVERLHHAGGQKLWVGQQATVRAGLWRWPAGGPAPPTPGSGEDRYPVIADDGERIAFVSDRSGWPELWLGRFGGDALPLTERRGGPLSRPVWLDRNRVAVTVYEHGRWSALQVDVRNGQSQAIAPDGYDLAELAAGDGMLWAIGRAHGDSAPAPWNLLRLLPDGERWRVEPTGLAAVAVRTHRGAVWIRQFLVRGVIELDPQNLTSRRHVGSRHFLDWVPVDGGIVHFSAQDALRTGIYRSPLDGGEPALLYGPDEAFLPGYGLAATADGSVVVTPRQALDEFDIVGFEVREE